MLQIFSQDCHVSRTRDAGYGDVGKTRMAAHSRCEVGDLTGSIGGVSIKIEDLFSESNAKADEPFIELPCF